MANPKGTTPANSGDGKTPAVEAKVHRLHLRPSIASERPGTAEGKAPRPENRKPEASPSREPHGSQVPASTPAPKKSWRRPLMFALLPVALVAGGYFYVTGGAVMSTDNAYVQADMVGLSTDVAGIVTQVLVHDNQKVAKGDILFKLDPLQFQLARDRAEAQIGNTHNDLVALQSSYRNMQAQVEQAQKDVDFNMVNFQRQEQLLANNFTPKATFDAARNTLQGSQQKLASLQQQLTGIAANLNGDPDAPIENHPAAARRHERGGECRHRTCSRISQFHNRSFWIGGLNMVDAAANTQPINRPAVTVCVILAVVMQALGTTIANGALPYIQGGGLATADQ